MRVFPGLRRFTLVAAATLSVFGTWSCTPETAGAHPSADDTREPKRLFGESDETIRRVLATAPIEKVVKGSGGRSVAFKLTFRGGVEGYFKPEQTFAAHWFSELASYYLDRELGLGRTPPSVGRVIEWNKLSGRLGRDERRKEVVVRNGVVRGSVVYWVPSPLTPVDLPRHWEAWLRVSDTTWASSPFQRHEIFARALRRGAEPTARKPSVVTPPPPREFPDRPAELSDLIIFDYLIGNLDRWSKDFTNVRAFGPSKPLVYLDNANGFHVGAKRSPTLEARLTAVERFRKSTVEAIRGLDVNKLERHMHADPLAPILTEQHLAELDERRRRVLAHVADVRRRHGERAIFF